MTTTCVSFKRGPELSFQPPLEDGRVARAVKQDRGGPAGADPGGNQGGPRSSVSEVRPYTRAPSGHTRSAG